MYKLAVFDLDGTLLNNQHEISDENINALNRLKKTGCIVSIATGRTDLLVKEYVKKIELEVPVIACNGGLIRNTNTGEILYKRVMPKNKVAQIIDICINKKITYMIYTKDYIITIPSDRLEYFEKRNEILDEDCKVKFIVSSDLDFIVEQHEVYKVLIIEKNSIKFDLISEQFNEIEGITMCQSSNGLMDFMLEGTSKQKAIELLAKENNILPEEIVAFGDNYNDIDMLRYAGCAITTSNGIEEVKSIANFISCSNNDNGIAYAIDNYILK